jgi:DNA-binding transcriptional LysR family regulator
MKKKKLPLQPDALSDGIDKLLQRKGLSLERLQTLLLVEEAGSLLEAAGQNKHRAAQFSRQIRELEEFFEIELTERSGRSKTLTKEGAELAAIAREFFLGMVNIRARAQDKKRWYRIGAGESLLHWIVIPGLAKLADSHKRTSFRLSNLQNGQIVARLKERTLDFGLLRAESICAPLKGAMLGQVSYCLVVPKALAATMPKGSDWRSVVSGLPLAVHLENTYVQAEFEGVMEELDLHPDIRLRYDTFPNAITAYESGQYAVLMVRLGRRQNFPKDCVVYDLPCLDKISRDIQLVWNPRFVRMIPDAESMRNHLIEVFTWPV